MPNRNDKYVQTSVSTKTLATIAKYLCEQGIAPNSISDIVRGAITAYAENLILQKRAEPFQFTDDAEEFLTALFGRPESLHSKLRSARARVLREEEAEDMIAEFGDRMLLQAQVERARESRHVHKRQNGKTMAHPLMSQQFDDEALIAKYGPPPNLDTEPEAEEPPTVPATHRRPTSADFDYTPPPPEITRSLELIQTTADIVHLYNQYKREQTTRNLTANHQTQEKVRRELWQLNAEIISSADNYEAAQRLLAKLLLLTQSVDIPS